MELTLQHLSKQYGIKKAVDNISNVLKLGVYGLLGANGAGKTTLMTNDMWGVKAYFRQHPLKWKDNAGIGRTILFPFRLYAAGLLLLSRLFSS